MTEGDMLDICKKIYGKTIASDIEPTKYEDIPKKISEILSRALKRNVAVSGSGLDGKDVIIDICSEKK